MVKKRVGNRIFITTEPKVTIYVPTEEDKLYGQHGTSGRAEYENGKDIQNVGYNIMLEMGKHDATHLMIADAIGVKESTILGLTRDTAKAQVSVLLKVCNYLGIELKDLL